MFLQLRWRVAIIYTILIFIIMIGLVGFLTWADCVSDFACIRRAIYTTATIIAFSAVFLIQIIVTRMAKPIHQLSQVAKRIAAGDLNAYILPHEQDEASDLTRSFNAMTDQLRDQITILREENHQFNMVLDYMADGILITDDLGYVRLINPTAARLLEVQGTAVLGRSFAEVVRHHQLIALWQKCQEEGEEQTEAVEVGRELFLQAVVTPYHEQETLGYLVMLHDLTQLRHLQTVRRDFISNISHELRTPLASVRAVVDTLQDGALDDPPAAKRFLDRAAREVDVLTQLVEELLELSRIESGQVPLRLKTTAVSELILTPMDRLRNQARRGEIELALDVEANMPPVLADADRVQQVIMNLLYNAIKFTPPGGKVTIRGRTNKESPDEAIIAVEDTGIGIPEADIPRIFERFYKSDRARTRGGQGGTGLGLAIAKHIVQAHNGRIWVKSKESKGSTFYFSLPLATDEYPHYQIPTTPAAP